MSESQHNIKVGVATEKQVNQEFVNAWQRALKDEITEKIFVPWDKIQAEISLATYGSPLPPPRRQFPSHV